MEEYHSSVSSVIPRRHSTDQEQFTNHHRSGGRRSMRNSLNGHHQYQNRYLPILNHDESADDDQLIDFHDVYGGPPHSTIHHHRFPGDFRSSSSNTFYNEIFYPAHHHLHNNNHHHHHQSRYHDHQGDGGCLPHEPRMRSSRSINSSSTGRKLPGFSIPSSSSSSLATATEGSSFFSVQREEGFYDDIFGMENGGSSSRDQKPRCCYSCSCHCSSKSKFKSKSKSAMSNSSTRSVLSLEDIQIPSNGSVLHSNINHHNNYDYDYDNKMMYAAAPATYPNHHSKEDAHHNHHREEEDAMFSSFASKLRPITVPTRSMCHDSTPMSTLSSSGGDGKESNSSHKWTPTKNSFIDLSWPSSNIYQRFSSFNTNTFQRQSSVTLEEPLAINGQAESTTKKIVVREGGGEEEGEGKGAADQISIVIEIDSSSHKRMMHEGETEGAAAVAEAIAWVKDKFLNQQQLSNDNFLATG